MPSRFRLYAPPGFNIPEDAAMIETVRLNGARQSFGFVARDGYLESVDEIPEPHEFTSDVKLFDQAYNVSFEEHEHIGGAAGLDNNMRAAVVHVAADAAVSVLVIVGLLLARAFGWVWMDPLVAIVGAVVIASWAVGLIRDTGGILLDMTPDMTMEQKLRDGDELADLYLWRLGPGHPGAILSVTSSSDRIALRYSE